MIVVQLKGGLGNQLFQYAAGFSLAKQKDLQLKVDVSELRQPDEKTGTIRKYELCNIINPPAIATNEEIEFFKRKTVLTYAQKLLPSYKRFVYNEKNFGFDENFFKSGSHIYLKGYRQSEKYFLLFEQDIRRNFQLKDSLINRVQLQATRFADVESVSIHIRRGDYTNAAGEGFHGSLPNDYYQAAIDKLSSTLKNPMFFIFSDNIDWVKNNLKIGSGVELVSGLITKNHYEDFFLMSRCKHCVIANSSFSWWSAWLNPNPSKIVIAPKKWFNTSNLNTKDLIPDSWIKL